MSLLLDARKKSQQGDHASLAPEPGQAGEGMTQNADHARNAGQNLFAAKSAHPAIDRSLPSRNVLYALGGTILLLATGMTYLWYVNSANNTTPLRHASLPSGPPARQILPAAATVPALAPPGPDAPVTEGNPPELAATPEANPPPATSAQNTPTAATPPRRRAPAPPDNSPIRIEQKKIETVDPLLSEAYLAYRSGTLDKARQLYLAMFKKDERNTDALLGLATIAQQRGETRSAVQYFGRLLALDPRNAAANAGMTALNADDDYNESRLKILLREQANSAILHFALGNLYARQLRWGEAQQAYFNAFLLESGNAEFAFNLAVSLDHLGQKKLAVQHYRQAMLLDPSHSAGFDHAQISQRAQELAR